MKKTKLILFSILLASAHAQENGSQKQNFAFNNFKPDMAKAYSDDLDSSLKAYNQLRKKPQVLEKGLAGMKGMEKVLSFLKAEKPQLLPIKQKNGVLYLQSNHIKVKVSPSMVINKKIEVNNELHDFDYQNNFDQQLHIFEKIIKKVPSTSSLFWDLIISTANASVDVNARDLFFSLYTARIAQPVITSDSGRRGPATTNEVVDNWIKVATEAETLKEQCQNDRQALAYDPTAPSFVLEEKLYTNIPDFEKFIKECKGSCDITSASDKVRQGYNDAERALIRKYGSDSVGSGDTFLELKPMFPDKDMTVLIAKAQIKKNSNPEYLSGMATKAMEKYRNELTSAESKLRATKRQMSVFEDKNTREAMKLIRENNMQMPTLGQGFWYSPEIQKLQTNLQVTLDAEKSKVAELKGDDPISTDRKRRSYVSKEIIIEIDKEEIPKKEILSLIAQTGKETDIVAQNNIDKENQERHEAAARKRMQMMQAQQEAGHSGVFADIYAYLQENSGESVNVTRDLDNVKWRNGMNCQTFVQSLSGLISPRNGSKGRLYYLLENNADSLNILSGTNLDYKAKGKSSFSDYLCSNLNELTECLTERKRDVAAYQSSRPFNEPARFVGEGEGQTITPSTGNEGAQAQAK